MFFIQKGSVSGSSLQLASDYIVGFPAFFIHTKLYIYIYIYIHSTVNSNTSPQRVLNNKGVGAGYIYREEWTTFSLQIDKLVS